MFCVLKIRPEHLGRFFCPFHSAPKEKMGHLIDPKNLPDLLQVCIFVTQTQI
ncbi:hypothetical protein C943_02522 [Mariniradius saccharolyticus AK6]|uniref:Uncharacterized protein n=1 Tax=Mariniradius saccharolyticus AK6 TaxID=1239962 RepID=M7X1M7_9BACT|nr:hypothetical protein C943_02522 [Mariniradius saccharolyticus AK6]